MLLKACSVCGLLSPVVIHGEPPALLPLLEPTVIYTGKCNSTGNLTRSRSTTNCVMAECQIKAAIISAKLCPICQSDRLIKRPSCVVLPACAGCCLCTSTVSKQRPAIDTQLATNTAPALRLQSTAPAIFHSLKRMYVFVHSTLESSQT